MEPLEIRLIPDEVWDRVRFCGRVYAVVAYLERNPRPLSLRHAAAIAGMERTSLSRLFRQRVGIGFAQFLNAYRLELAIKRLLVSDDTLVQIAADVGFGSLATFQRRFRREMGVSPSTFRGIARGARRRITASSSPDMSFVGS